MRTWVKWMGAAACALVAGQAMAADHGDGAAVKMAPEGDINDLYAWTSQDKTTLNLIMTIGGAGGTLTDFPEDVLYVFHVNRDDSALNMPGEGTTTEILCKFGNNTSVECWLGNADYVQGDPSAPAGIMSESGNLRVHAGPHQDPFFFFLNGLNAAIATVNGLASTLTFKPSGCPELSQAQVTLLQGQLTTGATDNFTNNVLSIVVEVKISEIPGDGDHFSIWSGTYAAAAN